MVFIHDFPEIIQSAIQPLEGLVGTDWELGPGTFDKLTRSEFIVTPTLGCSFAQNVTIPGDNFGPEVASIENNGGFLPGILGGGRTDNSTRNLQISFRETNLDFVDFVIRPWVIAASHLGMIARNDLESIKCKHIQIVQFSKRDRGRSVDRPVRKIYNYYGCTPFALEAKTLDYEGDFSLQQLVHSTQWTYDNYSVESGYTG
tara:strand:- start:43408 stop:44013 length:606 start_codon:yes stop_codon:yes gene_type:complete